MSSMRMKTIVPFLADPVDVWRTQASTERTK